MLAAWVHLKTRRHLACNAVHGWGETNCGIAQYDARSMSRPLRFLALACALFALGCGEGHIAGTHDAEVIFHVEGRAKDHDTSVASPPKTPLTIAQAAVSPVSQRLATMRITADVVAINDNDIKITLDRDQVDAAADALRWAGGIEIDALDPEFPIALSDAKDLTAKTETHDGKTVTYWEGPRGAIALAISQTKVAEGHKLLAQAYDSQRGRTRVVRTPPLAHLEDGVASVERLERGKRLSLVLRVDTSSAMTDAATASAGQPVAIVRGSSVLAVQPIVATTRSFEVSFGDDIYSYTRAHMTKNLLATPPMPPLQKGEVKDLAPDWTVAIACIVLPLLMSLAWLVFVRRFDRAQPEPWWLVLATFALGGFSVIPAAFAEYFLMSASPYLNPDVMTLGGQLLGLLPALCVFTLVVGVSEEGSKFLGAWSLARHRREFDEPVDGIVYGAASALGFAAIENIKYFAVGRLGGPIIVARAFTSVPAHMFFGAVWGYAMGQKLVRKRTSVLLYFLLAATFHGAFDTVLSIDGTQLIALVLLGILALLFVVFLRRALRHGAVSATKDEPVPSAQRSLFTMGSSGLTIVSGIALVVVALVLFGVGVYYEIAHHRVGLFFAGISATLLLLVGLAANGLAQNLPLDAAVDATGVTFAGTARRWDQIVAIERVAAWNLFGPRGVVRLRSRDGDLLIGPGNPTIVSNLLQTLNAAMAARPKA